MVEIVYDKDIQNCDSNLFSSNLWPGGIVTTRNWHLSFEDASLGRRTRKFKVLLRHGTVAGVFIVLVNGIPILKGIVPVTARVFSAHFTVDGKQGEISFDGTESVNFSHKLHIDNEFCSEMRNVKDSGIIEEDIPISVSIPNFSRISDSTGQYIMYQLLVTTKFQKHSMVERRFSDLAQFDLSIRSSLRQHLLVNMPSLPPKINAPWIDQQSDSFVSGRRILMEKYLNDLIGNSKVTITI